MQTATGWRFWSRFFIAVLVISFGLPVVVFTGALLADGQGLAAVIAAVGDQYRAPRQNLFLAGVPSTLPYLLLAVLIGVYRRRGSEVGSWILVLGGGLPIALVLLWANLSFWPLFLPGRSFPGWPHGLELVIGPLFFAPMGMLVGLVLAALALRRRL